MTDRIVKGFVAVWVAAAVLGLGFTGLVVWAIIRLVNHFT